MPIFDILDLLSHEELSLFEREGGVTEALRPEFGLRPDFDQICEREIMRRFAKEEAARAALAV